METVQAIANNRFDIMRQYRKRVLEPVLRQQKQVVEKDIKPVYSRARKLLFRETSLIKPHDQKHLDSLLDNNAVLRQIYDKSQELQELWRRRGLKSNEKMQALVEWCREAEDSGIRYLEEFAAHLKSYALRPA